MNILKISSSLGVVRYVVLGPHDLLVGRLDDCEIRLDDIQVSRQHAQIVYRDDRYLVEDLKSSNGTILNDEPVVSPTVLNDGDQIKIGHYQLDYQVRAVDDFDVDVVNTDSTIIHDPTQQQFITPDTEQQLNKARVIQQALLPTRSPTVEGLEFYSYYSSMESVGGDYFDYIELPGNRLGVVVGDVSGHGIDAAVLMSRFSAEARSALKYNPEPTVAVRELNRAMCELNIQHYVTAVFVIFDLATYQFELINAGHVSPLIVGADGAVAKVQRKRANFSIGFVEEVDFPGLHRQLNPGERLILFTDGLAEQKNSSQDMFGGGRLLELVQANAGLEGIATFGASLIQQHAAFFQGQAQQDDICLVCIGRPR